MTAHQLLSQLRAKGVELNASGDGRLVIDAPKGTITEDLRGSLATHKAELLEILQRPAVPAPVPVSEPARVSQPSSQPTSAPSRVAPAVFTSSPVENPAVAASV